jgi:hypothetical protein
MAGGYRVTLRPRVAGSGSTRVARIWQAARPDSRRACARVERPTGRRSAGETHRIGECWRQWRLTLQLEPSWRFGLHQLGVQRRSGDVAAQLIQPLAVMRQHAFHSTQTEPIPPPASDRCVSSATTRSGGQMPLEGRLRESSPGHRMSRTSRECVRTDQGRRLAEPAT